MIKAVCDTAAGDVVTFGLSRENVNRLLAGQPILVFGADVRQPQIAAFVIAYGETEAALEQELRDAGLL